MRARLGVAGGDEPCSPLAAGWSEGRCKGPAGAARRAVSGRPVEPRPGRCQGIAERAELEATSTGYRKILFLQLLTTSNTPSRPRPAMVIPFMVDAVRHGPS